jgi:hypothetical protein
VGRQTTEPRPEQGRRTTTPTQEEREEEEEEKKNKAWPMKHTEMGMICFF